MFPSCAWCIGWGFFYLYDKYNYNNNDNNNWNNGLKTKVQIILPKPPLLHYYINILLYLDLESSFFFHIFVIDRKKSFHWYIYIQIETLSSIFVKFLLFYYSKGGRLATSPPFKIINLTIRNNNSIKIKKYNVNQFYHRGF